MAKALAAQLDGVSADQVSAALATAEKKMRAAFESGDRPDPGTFPKTLASELGLSTDQVTEALRAAAQQAFEQHGGKPGAMPGPPGPMGFGPPPAAGAGSSSSGSG